MSTKDVRRCGFIIWTDEEPLSCGKPAAFISPVGPRCDEHQYSRRSKGRQKPTKLTEE